MKTSMILAHTICALALSSVPALSESIKVPERVAAAKKLQFCTEMAFPPWESIDPVSQKPVGFDIDISAAIAKQLGVVNEHKNISFDGLIPALQASQCDAIISGLYDKPERRQVVDFVNYAKTGTAIVLRSESDIKAASLADLSGRKVAVGIGTTGEGMLAEANEELKKQGKPPVNVIILQTSTEAFQQLMSGLVEAYISTPDQAAYYNSKMPNSVKLAGDTINKLATGIAVRKNDPEMLAAIEKALENMRKDGTYQAILEKWSFQALAFP
ncbi:ABC transporter substrate-binding protein [Rhizobium helianthi]|uniref:ABC transporter substrate-binding protein n=1 Tax=Rhizobium helianthi TaxID=1132695 RepID=A0ABW4M261_9HYPH